MADTPPFGSLAPASAISMSPGELGALPPNILQKVMAHLVSLASGDDPSVDSRWAQYAKPGLVEDRRNDVQADTHTWPRPDGVLQLPNVFDLGDGTMTALNASTDFIPQPSTPTPLSLALGVGNLRPGVAK